MNSQQVHSASGNIAFPFDLFASDEPILAYAGQNPVQAVDPSGLAKTLVVGIEPPAPNAITNGVLNVSIDPGHTFAFIYDTDTQTMTNWLSVGPPDSSSTSNVAQTDWVTNGTVSLYNFPISGANAEQCNDAFDQKKKDPQPYSPTNQCTSAVTALAGPCGVNIPNGIGPVSASPLPGTISVPNPYTLQQQLNQQMTPITVTLPSTGTSQ